MTNEGGSNTGLININVKMEGRAISDIAKYSARAYNNTLRAISSGLYAVWETTKPALQAKIDSYVAKTNVKTMVELEGERLPPKNIENPPDQFNSPYIEYHINMAARSQVNRENIIERFVDEIAQNPPDNDAKSTIDDDWLAQFWSLSEKVSKEDFQIFYAKLLSAEIKNPGAVSPLTLRTISVFSKEIAQKFQEFCYISFDSSDDVFVIHPHVNGFMTYGPLDNYGISYEDLNELFSYGLITLPQTILIQYGPVGTPYEVDYAGEKALLNFSNLQTHEFKFTRAGREIRRLLSLRPIPAFTAAFRERYKGALTYPVEASP